MADFGGEDGTHRNRPHQVLPYAFVLYVPDDLSEDAEADMKQTVLEWKRHFEMYRWSDKSAKEIWQKQYLLQQQQAQLSHQSSLLASQSYDMKAVAASGSDTKRMNGGSQHGLASEESVRDSRGAGTSSKRARESHSSSSVDSTGNTAKRSRQESTPLTLEKELEKMVEEVAASRPRSVDSMVVSAAAPAIASVLAPVIGSEVVTGSPPAVQTRDVGVQVKTHPTIISLQKKSVSLSATTQTPDLEKDDSYEAMLLRGRPLLQADNKMCVNCNRVANSSAVKGDAKNVALVTKINFTNKLGRPRKHNSLSERFADFGNRSSLSSLTYGK